MKTLSTLESRKRLGRFFRIKRSEKKLSQKFIAKKLGYRSSQYISNFERGLCLLPTTQMIKYSLILGIDKEEVYQLLISEQLRVLQKLFKVS